MSTPDPQLPPGRLVDPSRPVTFTFDGHHVPALAVQSIGAALYATGVRTFTRSFKYHRPRGLFCISGDCPNCLMEVDGRPNVRTCIEPVRDGQVVRHQNAWPSLDFDVLRSFDWLDRFLPVGFYYKRFHRPRWLWPIFEYVVRHIAGLGSVDLHARSPADQEIEHLHAEVCVVGGGPAGLAAAAAAVRAGASVLLLERQSRLGGHLLDSCRGEPSEVQPLLAAIRDHPQVQIHCDTAVFGLYEGNLLGAMNGHRLLKIRARQVIVCTGGRQQPMLFHNNDLPGIFLGRGVLRLAHQHGVRAGKRAAILTDSEEGERLAEQLAALQIEVVAVIDQRPGHGSPLRPGKWPTLASHVVLRASGTRHLKRVRVAQVDPNGRLVPGSERTIHCDLLCVASGLVPANELLHHGGVRFHFADGRWQPGRTVPGVWAAGVAAGTFDLESQVAEGRRCGAAAAAALAMSPVDQEPPMEARSVSEGTPSQTLRVSSGGSKRFVCQCEDVTEKDLERAVAEGFDGIETLKRYSTVNMGPCQGKMCGQTAIAVCARLTGRDINRVGSTTSRPPVVPVELGVLAAGQRHHPIRRTPLHHWHESAGASWLDAGLWKRPESYGDSAAEVQAVRNEVGLIDVSTLGKIELVGPDAAELLERVYLNKWSDLKVGRARYGAMCTEEGILFDDGVGVRLGPDRFYLTATTGNADGVFQWLELWKATWRLNVTVLNRTSAMAAMNLAGPRAREVLGRLCRLDLSSSAFPYLGVRDAVVADVPCRLMRLGFVGELGYEIHCSAALAWHLWGGPLSRGQGVRLAAVRRRGSAHPALGKRPPDYWPGYRCPVEPDRSGGGMAGALRQAAVPWPRNIAAAEGDAAARSAGRLADDRYGTGAAGGLPGGRARPAGRARDQRSLQSDTASKPRPGVGAGTHGDAGPALLHSLERNRCAGGGDAAAVLRSRRQALEELTTSSSRLRLGASSQAAEASQCPLPPSPAPHSTSGTRVTVRDSSIATAGSSRRCTPAPMAR
jgi:sarcosine oxidase subunit alpha